jgi:hypothetical protein
MLTTKTKLNLFSKVLFSQVRVQGWSDVKISYVFGENNDCVVSNDGKFVKISTNLKNQTIQISDVESSEVGKKIFEIFLFRLFIS